MGVWPKDSRAKLGDDYFPPDSERCWYRPRNFRGMASERLREFRSEPELLAKRIAALGPSRRQGRAGGCHARRVSAGGQADIIGAPPPREFSRLKTRKGILGEALATYGGWTVIFQNCSRPPFNDIEFRRAMKHAIDRQTIAEKIYFGLVEPSAIPAPRSGWWYDKQADEMSAYNLDKARAHLAKSAYPNGTEIESSIVGRTVSARRQGRGRVYPGGARETEHQGQPADDAEFHPDAESGRQWRLPGGSWRISCRPASRRISS